MLKKQLLARNIELDNNNRLLQEKIKKLEKEKVALLKQIKILKEENFHLKIKEEQLQFNL